MRRGRRLFSVRSLSFPALLGAVLGAISVVFLLLSLRRACLRGGEAAAGAGAVLFWCFLFSMAGIISSILSRRDPDGLYAVTYLGILLNGASLVFTFVCMFIGL